MCHIHVLVPEAAECFIESTDGLDRFAPERHVPAAEPRSRLVLRRVTRRPDIESAPVDPIPVRRETEHAVGSVARGIVMSGMIDEPADAADLGIVIESDHRSDPGTREPDVIVEKRDEIATGHPEARVARARGPESFGKFRDLKRESLAKAPAIVVGCARRMRLQNQNHLERLFGRLRREILETQLERIAALVGGNYY